MSKFITLTACDIGTSVIKGLTAKKDLVTGELEILGRAEISCFGVRNGEIFKPEEVAKTLVKVKDELSRQSGARIKEVLVNIGGGHLFSIPSQGLVSVSRADQRISQEDIQRALKASQAVNLPSNKEIIEVLPREFIVDGEGGIKDPLGLQGIRLEVKVLLICIFSPTLEHLERVFSQAGIRIASAIPTAMAVARSILSLEQKELGALVVDIGAGTTSVAVFEKGDLVNFMVFPIGSAKITDDIAIGLRTEIGTAEKIKREFAVLKTENKKPKASKKVSGKERADKIDFAEKSLIFSQKFLKDIVEERFNQILSEIQKSLKKISSGEPLPAGVFLTGGGSLLPGLVEFTKQKLKLPCRAGLVKEMESIEDPRFSVCAGLLLSEFDSIEDEGGRASEEGMGEKLKKLFRVFLP